MGFPDAAQQVDREVFPNADWETIFPRGNVSGGWTLTAIEEFATAEEVATRALAIRAAVPWGSATFAIRTLDLAVAASASESSRTEDLYTGTGAIERVSFFNPGHPTHLGIEWRLILGNLAIVP
jgi:hypothetical protein